MTFEERNREILKLRAERFTLESIGQKFGLTRERVRQIEIIVGGRTKKKNGEFLKPIGYTLTTEELKNWTLRKREAYPEKWKEFLREKQRKSLVPIEELKTWNKRKRVALGLPENVKFNNAGGLDFVREIVRTRDGHRCQRCFIKWKEGQRRFDVHHLDPEKEGKGFYRGNIKNDKQNIDEMITFCHKCHLSLPHLKEKMRKVIRKL